MKCIKCSKETDTVEVLWRSWAVDNMCSNCVNNLIATGRAAYFKWQYYYSDHSDITLCDACSTPIHRQFYNASGWYCLRCAQKRLWERARYCPQCGVIHRDWICNGWVQDTTIVVDWRLSFSVRRESKSRDPRGWASSLVSYVKKIWQFQTERDLNDNTQSMLNSFYHWCKTFKHYYTWEPIHIKWTVSYNNMKALLEISQILDNERRRSSSIVNWGGKLSKYHNCFLQWLDSNWLIKWKYIDTMWNVKERSESINKFMQEFKRETTNKVMTWEFDYVLSSDLIHKIKAFKLNEKVGSCQKSNNSDSYARWAYDAITNGCNCPILLYNKWSNEPFARITSRIMYDTEGQEYILIDRVYHSWEFGDSAMKGEIYKSIVLDLKAKWYKVIASNYSAHDESTYAYLASLWLQSNTIVKDLCQPLRWLVGNCGYYCDWWTQVLTGVIDWVNRATDYLDKAYVL